MSNFYDYMYSVNKGSADTEKIAEDESAEKSVKDALVEGLEESPKNVVQD